MNPKHPLVEALREADEGLRKAVGDCIRGGLRVTGEPVVDPDTGGLMIRGYHLGVDPKVSDCPDIGVAPFIKWDVSQPFRFEVRKDPR